MAFLASGVMGGEVSTCHVQNAVLGTGGGCDGGHPPSPGSCLQWPHSFDSPGESLCLHTSKKGVLTTFPCHRLQVGPNSTKVRHGGVRVPAGSENNHKGLMKTTRAASIAGSCGTQLWATTLCLVTLHHRSVKEALWGGGGRVLIS